MIGPNFHIGEGPRADRMEPASAAVQRVLEQLTETGQPLYRCDNCNEGGCSQLCTTAQHLEAIDEANARFQIEGRRPWTRAGAVRS